MTVCKLLHFIQHASMVLDVRTAAEFAEGHIHRAILIDQGQSEFVEKVKATLPTDKIIAIYCRSGRRSANALFPESCWRLRLISLNSISRYSF